MINCCEFLAKFKKKIKQLEIILKLSETFDLNQC